MAETLGDGRTLNSIRQKYVDAGRLFRTIAIRAYWNVKAELEQSDPLQAGRRAMTRERGYS